MQRHVLGRTMAVLCLSIALSGCFAMFASSGTPLIPISSDTSDAALERLHEAFYTPLVVIGQYVYLPPEACLPDRLFGASAEDRRLGGDLEGRRLGAAAAKRDLGGGAIDRRYGARVLDRRGGGDEEGRRLGGDEEGRRYGGSILGRRMGGDLDGRRLAAEAAKRTLGGGAFDRRYGAALLGRRGGGDAEGRRMGADEDPFRCEMLSDESGFRIHPDRSMEIEVFDGRRWPADGTVVRF